MNDTEPRDLAADQLRNSEARFRAFALASSDVLYRMSSDWSVMQQLDGVGFLTDTIGPNRGWLLDYIPIDEQGRVTAEVKSAIQAKSVFELEHRVVRADGTIGWTLSRAVPILDETGCVKEWIGSAKDVTVRKRIEEDLRHSEDLRRLAIAGGRMGVWRWNLHDDVIWGDAAFLSLRGYPASDEPRRLSDFTDRMSPQGRVEMGETVTRAIAAGEEFDGELEIVSGPTTGSWVGWRGHADGSGYQILHGVSFDITKQRQDATALRESQERLALAFRTLPVGIAILDVAGDIVTANDEMRRFLPTGKIPSRDLHRVSRWRGWGTDGQLVEPDDFPGARALRGETVSPGMQMLYGDDSDYEIWTEVLSIPMRDGEGHITGAISVVVDVDRVKRSEERAHASEERLRQFGEVSQDILWIRDAETLQWTYLTPAFETIYGLSREEALSGDNYRGWQELIVPEDHAYAVASIGRVRAGEHVTFEYRIRRPLDGRVRWLRNTDFPMRDAHGRVTRIGGVGHDVTEIKVVEAALRHSEHRLRTLVDGVPQLV